MKREQGLRRLAGLTTPLLAVGWLPSCSGQVAAQSVTAATVAAAMVLLDDKVEVTVPFEWFRGMRASCS
jgi:hypothetical protein